MDKSQKRQVKKERMARRRQYFAFRLEHLGLPAATAVELSTKRTRDAFLGCGAHRAIVDQARDQQERAAANRNAIEQLIRRSPAANTHTNPLPPTNRRR